MVARRFSVRHNDSTFDVDYDTDDGFEVLKFQLFSLTSVPPDQQKILGGDDDQVVSEDADLASVAEKLRLVSIDEDEETKKKENSEPKVAMSDEELARLLQAEEDALMMQQFVASQNNAGFEQKIRPYIDQVLQYEDPQRQEAARKTVPTDKLEEKALISLAREGNFEPTKNEQDHAFLLQLLFWFKQSFRWVNAPPCDSCGNETRNEGMGTANPSELQYGASRVELYRCHSCSNVTRFPRYNDTLKLLETRKGRCGEWANCFTLYCRAFGYESRLVLDFTDHVWTECFSLSLGRWMHLDPCEGIYDNPLLYEKGWNKKLNYVFGIAKDGVHDVTKRYTRKWPEVLARRNLITEPALSAFLRNITREVRKNLSSQMLSALEERDRNETEAIERDLYSKEDSTISLPGRLSGDKEWRISRSETGPDQNLSLSSSSCPVRRCIDVHVTKIYNAFSPIISKLVEDSASKTKAIDVLTIFRRMLVDLKNSPFRNRRTSLSSVSDSSLYFANKMLPSFGQLLEALSLKSDLGINGRIDICLAANPVRTAVALPVVFHALDDVIYNVSQCNKLDKDSLAWPLLKLNRLCSGLVQASGEELPFGIATSAFDGTRMSKWEEPNGAKGCWILYQVNGEEMHELVAYEFMSANDVPERDPKDWVIEGSTNGGSSWHVLDKQTNQIFDKRFQRKTYTVKSQSFLANAFRIRFLAVRDGKENPRFQIGSIDLYGRCS
nr:peptide-N(4)-(N-acetyl-beta-glucosaminyl) asparagine amidase [Ipomoea batatas]